MAGEVTERIQAVCAEFNKAGLLSEVSDNIQGLIWDKLLINVAAGALCGITRLLYGIRNKTQYGSQTIGWRLLGLKPLFPEKYKKNVEGYVKS